MRQSFKYTDEPNGWVKQVASVSKDGQRQICYVNDIHKAVHEFLAAQLTRSISCGYKYFITQRCWGFSIPISPEAAARASISLSHHSQDNCLYLLLGDMMAGCSAQAPRRPEEATIRLELADPAFYDKLTGYLASYGLGRAEEKTE